MTEFMTWSFLFCLSYIDTRQHSTMRKTTKNRGKCRPTGGNKSHTLPCFLLFFHLTGDADNLDVLFCRIWSGNGERFSVQEHGICGKVFP